MLGIIIGIGSVIAIETVGNSVTTTFTDSMTSMGATNIMAGVTQRKEEDVKSEESGLEFRGRRDEKAPEERDYIKDYMIEEFEKEFADDIEYVILSETLGNGTVTVNNNTAKVSVIGGNENYFKSQNLELVAGREIGDKAINGGKAVCLISDYAVEKIFKTEDNEYAIGKTIEATIGQ